MGTRKIPRPKTGVPNSPDEIFLWLEYLCLDSDCRGLGGYELVACPELLGLSVLAPPTKVDGLELRAKRLRGLLSESCLDDGLDEISGPAEATLALLGLTSSSARQPRAARRRLAADAMSLALDTFQKRYERRLLRDAAHELWGQEQTHR